MPDLTVNPASSAASATSQSASVNAAQNLTSDFNTFLQLLTAQVTNQDPLSPLDSTQFVEQLATFSGLEQQVATNGNLEEIVTLMRSSLGDQSTALLGSNVTTNALSVNDGAFSPMAIQAQGIERGSLVVRDAENNVVFQSVPATSWTWNGKTSSGSDVPPGTYHFEITNGETTIAAKAAGTVDRVIDGRDGVEVGFSEGVTASSYELIS